MDNEFDLGPVLDAEGKPVEDGDVLVLALETKTLDVVMDGLKYKVVAQRHRVPFRLTQISSQITRAAQVKNLKAAGFTAEDHAPGGVLYVDETEHPEEEAAREKKLSADPRWAQFLELQSSDESVLRARANVAAAAICATNAPGLRDKKNVTGADLLKLGRIGEAVIEVVGNFMQSSPRALIAVGGNKNSNEKSTPNTEATPTKTNPQASGKGKSNTSRASTKARPQPTS